MVSKKKRLHDHKKLAHTAIVLACVRPCYHFCQRAHVKRFALHSADLVRSRQMWTWSTPFGEWSFLGSVVTTLVVGTSEEIGQSNERMGESMKKCLRKAVFSKEENARTGGGVSSTDASARNCCTGLLRYMPRERDEIIISDVTKGVLAALCARLGRTNTKRSRAH